MKIKRWIALLLILTLTLALFCGCKSTDEEDFSAVSGDLVKEEQETEEENEPSKEEEKTEEEPSQEEEKTEEETPKEEEGKKEEEKEETPADTPAEETPEEEEPDVSPVTKETSGTPITFLIQNLRVGGHQTADTQGQRTDTLGRTGQANELYSRARRFRLEVQEVDPDVILTCEGTEGWTEFLKKDPYFAKTYRMLYQWRNPDGFEINQATPLLYKSSKYELVNSGHFWHSETPNKQSICYDTEGYRICTWAKLRDRSTGAEFYAYTCHISNNSNKGGIAGVSTMEQYQTVLDKLPKDAYAFVGGDYNIGYRDAVYQLCMEWDRMIDLKDQALNMQNDGLAEIGGNTGSVCTVYEKDATGGNYGTPIIQAAPKNSQSIDHLMAKPNPHMAVDYWGYNYTTYDLPEENVAEGYISDHYGLVVKVRIGTDADYSQYQVEH